MTARRRFPPEVASVRAARVFAVDSLRDISPAALDLDATAVMVSELASNSVIHARSAFEVEVEIGADRIRVGVTDADGSHPAVQEVEVTARSGRGLHIIDALSDRWGVDDEGRGKTVWFELALRSAQPQV